PIAKQVYQNAACCVAISPALKQIFQQNYQVKPIEIIPNPIDSEIFHHQPKPINKNFTFVQIGDLIPLKRPLDTLFAFAKMANRYSNIRLQFIGSGPFATPLQKEIQNLKLTDWVELCGQQKPLAVAKYVHQANALVHTSSVETFGLVLAEAMCCGRPVVAVKSAGANFIITPESGILIESGVEAVAAGMEQIIENYARFNSQIIAKNANDRFGSEAVIRQLIMLYERLR
ncbi:MAG: glycosyltransferase, partial [Saprospiraceae bacterium]